MYFAKNVNSSAKMFGLASPQGACAPGVVPRALPIFVDPDSLTPVLSQRSVLPLLQPFSFDNDLDCPYVGVPPLTPVSFFDSLLHLRNLSHLFSVACALLA